MAIEAVHFLFDEAAGLVRIARAKGKALAPGGGLVVIGTRPGSAGELRRLQRLWRGLHIKGDWYLATPTLVSFARGSWLPAVVPLDAATLGTLARLRKAAKEGAV